MTMLSVAHWIVPGPKMKLEGPPPIPEKLVNVPDGWLGMRRKSKPASVKKEVAVRGLPRASAVGVMEHAWLSPYADGKLGERMQFGALGSLVQRPEVTAK